MIGARDEVMVVYVPVDLKCIYTMECILKAIGSLQDA